MSGGRDSVSRLKQRLADLPGRLRGSVNDALQQMGDDTVAEIRRVLASSGGSQPSRPGDPPRDPAGRIAQALAVRLDEARSTVTVVAASPEARFLEYGTRSMAARPFVRPAVSAVMPAALAACRAALAAAAAEPDP